MDIEVEGSSWVVCSSCKSVTLFAFLKLQPYSIGA